MSNMLAFETSPYLRQHANNPVDWLPWSDEALARAQREDKPIFLSIGYAACHWCHVMAHESFEDPSIARLMNEHFINIKVDREERPDLDAIYMNAVVSMTGQGGWPMSVFLTPEGQPFYGGTYFPPKPRYGMPGFEQVLTAIQRLWQGDRSQVFQVSRQLAEHLQATSSWGGASSTPVTPANLETVAQKLIAEYDWEHGGWGKAPLFPAPMTIEFLLQQASRGSALAGQTALHALRAMHCGGLYDVVGGGFHRYSTDHRWLVPHFEKMLYDNAQLAQVYLHAYGFSGEEDLRHTAAQTLDFLLREMQHPLGGFYSSLDADSEGEEGKYYLWSLDEINAFITDSSDRELFMQVYPVSAGGNFEGKNILQRKRPLEELAKQHGMSIEALRQRLDAIHLALRQARVARIRPQTDDKVLAGWNGLALQALAQAAAALDSQAYLQAAQRNAAFLLDHLYHDGRLLRSWRDGKARHNAYLEDYASVILGLLALYQVDGNLRWFHWAERLAGEMQDHFSDSKGGFFDTRQDHGKLVVRPKGMQDNAIPSGNALAALAQMKLAEFNGNMAQKDAAIQLVAALWRSCLEYPSAFAFWLQAMDFAVGAVQQIALVWPRGNQPPGDWLAYLHGAYRPRSVLAFTALPAEGNLPALLQERPALQNTVTAYVCQGFVCQRPVTTLNDLRSLL